MKNKKILSILTMAIASFAIASCEQPQNSSQPTETESASISESVDESSSPSEIIDVNKVEFSIQTGTGNVTSHTLNLNLDDISSSTKTNNIQLVVKKGGEDLFDQEITYSITGDEGVISSVKESATVDNEMIVTFAKTGTATITFTLQGHDVNSVSITYNVSEDFLNSDIYRGENVESNGTISMNGLAQHTAVAKKSATSWKLNATLKVPHITKMYTSVGIGSFLDNGDHALWASVRNTDGTEENSIYEVYVRDFYNGWDIPNQDSCQYDAYKKLDFGGTNKSALVKVELIRDGLNYYYNIGGYHGKYCSTEVNPTYPGFFSQEIAMTISDYFVSYDETIINEAITANYGENAKIDAVKFVNPDTSEIVRGQTRKFDISSAPSYSTEKVVYSVCEEYASSITIDENGLLTVGNNAAEGYATIYVKNQSGEVADSVTFEVLAESSAKENNLLRVKGGVILNDENSITFPEYKIGVDGVVNENKYVAYSSVDYSAELKQKVLGGDFTIEFDVTNYKTSIAFPKLMLSLGGESNNFYVVYNREGSVNRIESFTQCIETSDEGAWINSNEFSNFDTSATHHFKLESKNGYYYWYVDNSTTPLAFHTDGAPRNVLVQEASYYDMLPVRFATKGVSCSVENIQVRSGSLSDLPKYFSHGSRVSETNDEYTVTFANDGWGSRRNHSSNLFTTKDLADLSGAWTLKFDVVFNASMNDGKVIIKIGEHEFHFVNSTGWGHKIEHCNVTTNTYAPNNMNVSFENLTYSVTITKDANGNVTVSVPGKDGNPATISVSGVNATSGYFYGFNETAADQGKTATIKNIEFVK